MSIKLLRFSAQPPTWVFLKVSLPEHQGIEEACGQCSKAEYWRNITLSKKKNRSFKLVPVASSGLLQVSSVPHKGTLNSRHLSENSCLQTLKKKGLLFQKWPVIARYYSRLRNQVAFGNHWQHYSFSSIISLLVSEKTLQIFDSNSSTCFLSVTKSYSLLQIPFKSKWDLSQAQRNWRASRQQMYFPVVPPTEVWIFLRIST